MKIVQIVHGFPPESIGGTEMYTQAISRRLLERGHRCHVLAGTSQPRRDAGELDDGVHVTRLAGVGRRAGGWFPAYDPEIEHRVRGYLDDLKPDVVHIHHWVSLTANLVALCAEMGLPTIVTLHDLAVICPRGNRIRFDKVFCTDPLSTAPCLLCVEREPWQKDHEVQEELALRQQMVREGLHLADRLLVPSQTQKDFLAEFLDVPADRLEVLPHGTLHDLRPVGGSAEATSQRPLRIGHWGHLIWQKGPHLLLEAVRKLSDPRAVEVHLMGEAGDPAYQQELDALAQDLAVTFHGAFTPADLTRLDLDVAVFPGLLHESHSFVLDEAFQLGLPVVVSSRGAPAERVGSAGLVFSAGVVGDLVAKIEALLADPALLEQLRRGTPKDPPHPMSEHIVALEGIYRKVTRSRGKKSVSRPNYLKLLILRQHQLAEREAALAREQVRYQQLQTQALEYQGHLERDLAQVKDEYQQLQTQALEYQGRLERDLAQVKDEYQQLQTQAQEYQGHVERELARHHAEALEYQGRLERQLEKAKAEYEQLQTQALEYQGRLERDLAQVKDEYQQLQTQALEYQGNLERDLAQAKAAYQQLHTQAREYQGHLERELAQWQGTDRFLKDQLQIGEKFLEFQQEHKRELERVWGELRQLISLAEDRDRRRETAVGELRQLISLAEDRDRRRETAVGELRQLVGLAEDRDRWRETAEGLSRHVDELQHQHKWRETVEGLGRHFDDLQQQIRNLSQERDQLEKALDRLLAHSAVRLYLRTWELLSRRPEER